MPKSLGFTLVEILVVIAVISILVVVLLPQLGQFNQAQSLSNSASDLETALRTAQNDATSGVICPSTNSASDWFVKFYYDTSLTVWTYKIGSNCPPTPGATPTPYLVSSAYLWPGSVSLGPPIFPNLSGCSLTLSNTDGSYFSVNFSNISGKVFLNSSDTSCGDLRNASSIQIPMVGGGSTSLVNVDKGGSIYVKSP